MLSCDLCDQTFANNLGGRLTNHLRSVHDSSLEEYMVRTAYEGNPPRCACGLCEERPHFRRGKFERYAKGHRSFAERERRYVEKFGVPTCQSCGKEVGFYRGDPRTYCSHRCSGKDHGFSCPETQETIRERVREKYGVDVISQTPEVRKRIGDSHRGKKHRPMSEEGRRNIGEASRRKWLDPDCRARMKTGIREAVKDRWKDPAYRAKILATRASPRLSKLHRRFRGLMGLPALGFVSEQVVGGWRVDELHPGKVIGEVNGDYPHANPKRFGPEDRISLRGWTSYLAREKWEKDKKRLEGLEALGYQVVVVWESDDLDEKLVEIRGALGLD